MSARHGQDCSRQTRAEGTGRCMSNFTAQPLVAAEGEEWSRVRRNTWLTLDLSLVAERAQVCSQILRLRATLVSLASFGK